MRRIVGVLLLFLAPAAAASIRGTIVAGTHLVANAKITAYAVESGDAGLVRILAKRTRVALGTTTSAADGAFTLPIDGAGCVDVRAEAAGFAFSLTEQAIGDSDVVIGLAPKHSREITLRSPDGPVAGAHILALVEDVPRNPKMRPVETITDDRGTFTLDYADVDLILVVHPRVSLGFLSLGPQEHVVNVDAGVTLKGKVVDVRGAGVRNAKIQVDDLPIGESGRDGSFTIERAPRTYKVLTAKSGELSGSIPYTAGPLTITMKPYPPRNEVRGVVRDEARRPLRGISILLQGESDSARAITDEKGAFAVRVAPGKYTVIGLGADWRDELIEALDVQKSVVRDFVATRPPMLTGVVRLENGSPVGSALVTLATDDNGETGDMKAITALDGRFRIAIPDMGKRLRLLALKPGLPPAESELIERKEALGGREAVIVVPKAIDAGGTVTDGAGHPLAGVAVTAQRSGRAGSWGVADPPVTDAEGRFSIRIAAGTWQAGFQKDGYMPYDLPPFETSAANEPLKVALEPAAAIRGHVMRNGKGLQGVRLSLDHSREKNSVTASDGSFVFPSVRPGTYLLCDDWRNVTHPVTAPADDVRIVLDTGAIRLHVIDAAGAPVTQFFLDIRDSEGGHGLEGREGLFVKGDAPPGKATISVTATGFLQASKSGVVVEVGKTTEVTMVLTRSRSDH